MILSSLSLLSLSSLSLFSLSSLSYTYRPHPRWEEPAARARLPPLPRVAQAVEKDDRGVGLAVLARPGGGVDHKMRSAKPLLRRLRRPPLPEPPPPPAAPRAGTRGTTTTSRRIAAVTATAADEAAPDYDHEDEDDNTDGVLQRRAG